MLSIDTITREQIIQLIEKENKRKIQCKEAQKRFIDKLKESGELQAKREKYNKTRYTNMAKRYVEDPNCFNK